MVSFFAHYPDRELQLLRQLTTFLVLLFSILIQGRIGLSGLEELRLLIRVQMLVDNAVLPVLLYDGAHGRVLHTEPLRNVVGSGFVLNIQVKHVQPLGELENLA